ncbi:MAG: NADH:flavin oxidoreductase [Actinomycetota bacterium]|nr:NADH:flavin oxidoreductase [Acidimicrobiia bacterium]MDQ3293389.1 NADH:flavin oxidoreductase [Actinomycetota bacterium]
MGATLHTPLQIGGTTTVRNRLYRAPVLEGAGDGDDCADRYAKHFVENARHGVGLVIQGSSCIASEGRSSPGMTLVHTRERVLRLAPMVDAVHREGAAIWLQIGHGGIFAMEAWHQPYASQRQGPLVTASPPRWWLKPLFRRAPVHAMSTDEVRAVIRKHGEVAAWAREAGYDGLQLGSSNAKLLDQFLSPFWNRRTDEYGGSHRNRARIVEEIRRSVAEHAGADFTCTIKVPIDEHAPPLTPRTTWDEGLELARWCEEWGFDSVTPVEVSVFPDTTLTRGGVPRSLWDNKGMKDRFAKAAPRPFERKVIEAGYWVGGKRAPFKPVWNRSRFEATKRAVSIPVFAVGGIRTRAEVEAILDGGHADLVGIGRPFYAEPDLPRRILADSAAAGDPQDHGLCVNSNLCVPAQMLGMKGACYNPAVVKVRSRG